MYRTKYLGRIDCWLASG